MINVETTTTASNAPRCGTGTARNAAAALLEEKPQNPERSNKKAESSRL